MSVGRFLQQAAAGNSGGIPWDISTAVYNGRPVNTFFLDNETNTDFNPHALFFKSDGLAFYTVGDQNDDVLQYNLTTAWDLFTASFTQKFDISAQETSPTGLFFKDDGTKMFVLGNAGNDITEYALSTAWDISTASYDSVSFSVSSQESTPTDVAFNSDGTKMYVVGSITDNVYQYSLSTAYNLSTASYDSISISVATTENEPFSLEFNSDGSKMYILGNTTDTVYQYSTSVALTAGQSYYVQTDGTLSTTAGDPSVFAGTAVSATKLIVKG